MWGAGGPGGSGGQPGGGGAYLTGTLAVSPGETLKIIVGQGGQYGTATQWSTMTDAQGGGGGGGGLAGQGGQGGGRSAIQKLISGTWTEIVTAGGGGSAGGNAGTYGGNAYYTGTSQSAGSTYGQGRTPTGGSASAGGLNTFTANVGAPWDGTQFTGGFASNAFNVSPVTGACGGGGGGGGYYGGGGGGRSGADTYGGGGGSSYYNATYVTNFSGSNGNAITAVATNIPGYVTGSGMAGAGGSTNSGSNGLIVFAPTYSKLNFTALNIVNLGSYTKGSTVIRSTTGQYYTITVPGGAKYMLITMWGAAGAGRGGESGGQGNGAYISGVLKITTGAQYRAIVGKGGSFNHDAADYPYYGGGGVGDWSLYGPGGDGGGRSAIQMLSNSTWVDVATAGGGGGSAGDGNTGEYGRAGAASASGPGWQGGPHYAGGSNAVKTTSRNGTGGSGGGGGTSSGGEAGLYGASTYATAGSLSQGGNAGYAGGAGGGGYYGGGGGVGDGNVAGAGGGGSSYTALLANLVGYDGTDSNISTPTLYVSGHGVTTEGGGDSLDGIVYYTFYS